MIPLQLFRRRSSTKTGLLLTLGYLVLLAVSVAAALAFGSENLPMGDILDVLSYHLTTRTEPKPDVTADLIVWHLRMPRIVLALIVGGGLSVAGVAIQALVRNPLAEPYILGISSGASAGASLFYLGFFPPIISQALSMPLAAFFGGTLAILIVYSVARTGTVVSVTRLLLAGVAISALMAAFTSFITLTSPNPYKLQAVLFWLLGSLSNSQWNSLILPSLTTFIGLIVFLGLSRTLDAFLLGEEPARSLGIPTEITKRFLLISVTLITGTLVAFSGTIGFVGLIIPHAVRSVVGVTHRRLIPVSFGAGALFLLWADLAARTIHPPQEIPVGIFTALCGVPFFLFLLRRKLYHFG